MAYKLSLVMLKEPADAEDAVSEAFIKAYAALPRCREDTIFKSWFLKITYNCCQDIIRKRKKHRYTPLEDYHQVPIVPSPVEDVILNEENREVWRALKQLSHEDRSALVMKYYHGLSYQDIAHNFNWPLGTVASRLFRARERLSQLLIRGEGYE